ncbi:Bor family protein [Candidatus Palauibacter irciniicola]|uniref:Bor family protein n=1 Tax=Candidatus Palauibacter irciniicola TaxID=3056733 RepID=UPI003B02B7DD
MGNSIRGTSIVLVLAFVLAGCYKTTVRTGIQPGPVNTSQSKATWINGLVPASDVEAEDDCGDSGVAVVQTELSFVNQLIGLLTLGIYTPVTVRLVCGNQDGQDDDGAGPKAGAAEMGGEPPDSVQVAQAVPGPSLSAP